MKKFQIWYMRRDWFSQGIQGAPPDAAHLRATHVHVTDISFPNDNGDLTRSDDLEMIFNSMQGEVWSPNGEARELLLSKGLSHTSMSIGDVVVDSDDRIFIVAKLGFEEVFKEA